MRLFSGLIEMRQVERVTLGPSPKQVFGRQSGPWDCLGVRARSSRELLIQSYGNFFFFLNFVLPLQTRGPSNDPSGSSALTLESADSWEDVSVSASLNLGHCSFPIARAPEARQPLSPGVPNRIFHLGSH